MRRSITVTSGSVEPVQGERVVAALGLGADLDVRLEAEHVGETHPNQIVVVDEHDADAGHGSRSLAARRPRALGDGGGSRLRHEPRRHVDPSRSGVGPGRHSAAVIRRDENEGRKGDPW